MKNQQNRKESSSGLQLFFMFIHFLCNFFFTSACCLLYLPSFLTFSTNGSQHGQREPESCLHLLTTTTKRQLPAGSQQEQGGTHR